jgi:hypothetical protein
MNVERWFPYGNATEQWRGPDRRRPSASAGQFTLGRYLPKQRGGV